MVIWERAAGVMEGWAELVAVILIFERLMLARRSRVGWVSSTVMQYDCMQEARSRSSSMLVFTFFLEFEGISKYAGKLLEHGVGGR